MKELENRTIRKVMWRLMPFLFACYFVAYLDRVNVGFAKLQMNSALGMSESAYGLGAGLFFIAYFLLEVPSNLALARFGARLWIARIMFSWGLISGLFAFIQPISHATGVSSEWVFFILRFLLGIAEAGFFPGIIFFLTLWFPSVYRARVVAMFMLAIPFSSIVGAPLSGALLNVTGASLDGWQWLFIIEAVPSILMAIAVIAYLTDRPEQATWLRDDERAWLVGAMASERAGKQHLAKHGVLSGLFDPRVLALGLIYFGTSAGLYTLGIWSPQIIKQFGLSDLAIGFANAAPAIVAVIAMVLWARHSDRTGERTWHVVLACLLACAGLILAGGAASVVAVLVALTMVNVGISASKPPLWSLPTLFLSGSGAAAGIATINSVGNLGGFFGPTIIGWIKEETGSFAGGLYFVAALLVVSALITLLLARTRRSAPVSAAPAAHR